MIIIEVNKNERELIEQLKNLFPENVFSVENAFNGEELVSFLVSLSAALAASPVLIKLLETNQLTIKYDNIQIKGSPKHVIDSLKMILDTKETNDDN